MQIPKSRNDTMLMLSSTSLHTTIPRIRKTGPTLQWHWNFFRWQQTDKWLSKQVGPVLQTSTYTTR